MKSNIFRWSDSILFVCKKFGLQLPPEVPRKSARIPMPSDYLGKNFELDAEAVAELKKECNLNDRNYEVVWKNFNRWYKMQKNFRHNRTDLNIFFADFVMFSRKRGYTAVNYFYLEFYGKSTEEQNSFLGKAHLERMQIVFQDYCSIKYLHDKTIIHRLFADFIRREHLDLSACSLDEFKSFVGRHPKFFVKPATEKGGKGARIVSIEQISDLEAFFKEGQSSRLLVEEIIKQHPAIAEFCPDTLNSIRINTLIDIHGTVRIVTASGRFGRRGNVVDYSRGRGFSVIIDPITGEIISDGLNVIHERVAKHPDSGKTFRGFRYPHWNKVRAMAIKMAKVIPTVRHVGWDIAVNADGDAELIEGNSNPSSGLQQAADSVGRLHLYLPFIKEWEQYKREHLQYVGYTVNNIDNFAAFYQMRHVNRRNGAIQFAVDALIDNCKSLIDVGCRAELFAKTLLPPDIEYLPVDFRQYDNTVVQCDFNSGTFPDISADTVLSVFTAEFIETLPEFLDNISRAARRQVLMISRPIDKETAARFRWEHPFIADFTEKFLIESIEKNGFTLNQKKEHPESPGTFLYDFRRSGVIS